MSFRRLLSPKPLSFIGSAIVGTASVTVSVVMFFSGQKTEILNKQHELEVQAVAQEYQQKYEKVVHDYEEVTTNTNSRLATIERRLGGTSNTFDVTKLIVSPKDAAAWLNRSHYFAEGRFYGRKIVPGEKWSYEVASELKMVAEVSGMQPEELKKQMAPEQARALEQFPMHVWRSPKKFHIGGEYNLYFSPMVTVQKVPHTALAQLMGELVIADQAAEQAKKAKASQAVLSDAEAAKQAQDSIASLNSMYRGDATGLLLGSQLNVEMQLAAAFRGRAHTYLKEIQKAGNVVYAQFETVLKDMIVDDVPQPQFYLLREILLVSTPEEIYLVKTVIPTTPDFGNEAIAWINGWYGDFGIPEQGGSFSGGITRSPHSTQMR